MRNFLLVAFLLLAGCTAMPGHVQFPDARSQAWTPSIPAAAAPAPAQHGAIFAADSYRPLFEDNRARRAGDILTVNLVEKTSASRKATSKTDRGGSASAGIGDIAKLPIKGLSGLKFDGESSSKFEGKGETASDVLLQGTLTVTVQHVLPNGNLVVAGEKQIGVNTNVERLRLTGIVNPTTIVSGNTVASNLVADARIELSGRGILDEAQTMGFLQRFFLSVLPI